MNKLSLLMGLALGVSAPAVAEKDATKFTAADIFNLEYATNPRVSPDGKHVLFERRSNDIMADSSRTNLWIAKADGSALRPLLTGTKSYRSARWSPSGNRIAYLSNAEGSTQLYVRWMDTGQTAVLTNVQSGIGNITWSPDGTQIAFTMSVPKTDRALKVKMPKKPKGAKWSEPVKYITKARYQRDGRGIISPAFSHVFVIPATGGSPRQLTSGDYPHGGSLSWAKDGHEVFFSANRSKNWEYEGRESDIYAVSLAGKIRQITNDKGAEYSPAVSPNGKVIAYISSDNQKLAFRPRILTIRSLDTGDNVETKQLTKGLDRAVRNIQWDKKGKGLYYQFNDHGVTNVGYTDTLYRQHAVLAKGLGGTSLGRPYSSGTFHAKAGTIAYTKGSASRPADLHVMKGKKNVQLTALNEDVLAHKKLGTMHEITYKSSIDGEEIQGWYILPPNYDASKKYPVILEIHGGPHLSYGPHFTAELQRFAAEGYVVFFDNHRGSTGYGERFALLLQNKYSSKYDFADHMSGLDALIDKGIVDQDRLFIAGGSAGGIASAYAIGLTDRFKAAAVAKPVINWISKVLTADSYLGQIPNQFPGLPWDNVEHYWKRSPLSLVGNVTTPTLLITGEADRRTPISETEQFYQALKLLKVDTIMIRVPGSPHGIAGRPSRMIAKVENILAWFKKYDVE